MKNEKFKEEIKATARSLFTGSFLGLPRAFMEHSTPGLCKQSRIPQATCQTLVRP